MTRMNCWEFMECGREPMGEKVHEMGECPVCFENKTDGINQGKNGGRTCWAIAGTFCDGQQQGTYAEKLGNCLQCDFYAFVRGQERMEFVKTKEILGIISYT